MSKDYSYYQYEVLLTSAKITKPERYKDSDFFVASDMSDYKREHKVVSKEKYTQILTLLKGDLNATSTKQQVFLKLYNKILALSADDLIEENLTCFVNEVIQIARSIKEGGK